MNLLVIGGTLFLGRHVVEHALAAGHRVTLFNRGLTQAHLFDGVEKIHGDRDGGLLPLLSRHWDGIIDTCGFVPRVVRQSAALACSRYVYVSTVMVYADLARVPVASDPTLPGVEHEDHQRAYGPLKAACEREVLALGERGIVVRPGLIGGPHDPTGRFTYWPVRLADGGRVVAPLPREAHAQVIDARDLAAFLVRLAAQGPCGIFNGVGRPYSMAHFLETVRDAVNPGAELCWLPPEALEGITPWRELPLWLPDPAYAGMTGIDPAPSEAAGLSLRPLADTARDTLAWARSLDGEPARQADGRYIAATLSRQEEERRLAAWDLRRYS